MVRPTTPIAKEIFGHWAVLIVFSLAAVLVLSLPAVPAKRPARAIPAPSARFVSAPRDADSLVPAILRPTLPAELLTLPTAVPPPPPPLPPPAGYQPLEMLFPTPTPAPVDAGSQGPATETTQDKEPAKT